MRADLYRRPICARRSPSRMRFLPGHERRRQQDAFDQAVQQAAQRAFGAPVTAIVRHNWRPS